MNETNNISNSEINILNLYAGIGGNRKLWTGNIKVTAVESNPVIADIYQDFFPDDNVIVLDAHLFLQENFSKYDFIWSSPPCQTHSGMRQNLAVRYRGTSPEYPDMRLYQEIIFLKHNFKGLWCVENVRPYYKPLILPSVELQRHILWANFLIKPKNFDGDSLRSAQIQDLQKHNGISLEKYKIPDKRQILRNCVYPELGEYVFSEMKSHRQPSQIKLF